MRNIYIAAILALYVSASAYAELTTESPAPNETRISRNGELLLVKGEPTENSWMEHVYFKGKPVLLRTGDPVMRNQVFYENTPIKVAEVDTDNDGQPDEIQLVTVDGSGKTIYDLLHIGPDGRLTPFSDQELQAEQEKWSKIKDSQQGGPECHKVSGPLTPDVGAKNK